MLNLVCGFVKILISGDMPRPTLIRGAGGEFSEHKTYFNFLRGGRIIGYIIVVLRAPAAAVTLATTRALTRATMVKRIA